MMYRLFKIASTKSKNVNLPASRRISCTLCNRNNALLTGHLPTADKLCSRNFSTEDLNPLQNLVRRQKKQRKPKKKYAELVEVNDGSSNLTKALVRKLSAKDVSQLTKIPEVSLEQFHYLVEKSKTKVPNLSTEHDGAASTFIASKRAEETDDLLTRINLSPLDEEVLQRKLEEENEWEHDTENVGVLSDVDTDFKFPAEKLSELPTAKVKKKIAKSSSRFDDGVKDIINGKSLCENKSDVSAVTVQEEHRRITRFNENLSSYLELCVLCNTLNVGLGTLDRYCRLQKFNKPMNKLITSPRPYNTLLHGFAAKANVDKILLVMRLMASSEVSFTPQTFAACFECCGRLTSSEHTELLTMFYKQFTSHGFKLQDLVTQCSFVRDQRELVMKAVKILDKNFVPEFESVEKNYSQPFLQPLNDETRVYRSPAEKLLSDYEMNMYFKEQANAEVQTYQKIRSVIRPEKITPRIEHYRNKWNELETFWRTSIREVYVRHLNDLELQQSQTKTDHVVNVYPYLKVLSPEVYVDVIIMEIHKLLMGSETFSPYLRTLQKELGKSVKNRYYMKFKQQSGVISKVNKIYKDYCKWYLHPETNTSSKNTRHQWQRLCSEYEGSGPTLMNNAEKHWPPEITLEVGKFLYNIIIKDIKIDVNAFSHKSKAPRFVPAFYSLFRYQGTYLIEEVKPSPVITKLFKETCSEYLMFDINMLPMVSPPIPWTSPTSGGYLYTKVDFMRLYNFPMNPCENTPNEQMYPVFDSLNQLGSVPWKVNESVLDVMLKVFRDGGSKKLNIPLSTTVLNAEQDPKVQLNLRERMNISRKKSEMYSLWCDALYRLSLADHFRNRTFWLPHNLDFRGRVYPVPPHLTHLGSDLARALLCFAKGKKLGPEGLDWLKVHCINLTGLKKKESISERLCYANKMLPEMLDSAEKPLTGKMWWAQSDEDIWQTLACCMEIKAALDSGDPENFVSHFPIHQDGSCNGLQHYAALGRDKEGGASVNLTPAEKPQDVYSCVVSLVETQRKADAENGVLIAQKLEGFIKRKVIKQTIMTTVYGVTKYGARLQIAKQLKDIEDFPQSLVWPASLYLVSKTFICLQEMFTTTKEIQDWFTDCAKVISGSFGKFVEWDTPLGLPVVQPYCKFKKPASGKKNQSHLPSSCYPIAVKQKNAFPPNYIHSLDSSHMMLTSLHCEKEGITFVSVHDCYWTHPCSVKLMNKICREQFVTLHSQPLLENLSDGFKSRYIPPPSDSSGEVSKRSMYDMAVATFSRIPQKGTLNLEDVIQSQYFFS